MDDDNRQFDDELNSVSDELGADLKDLYRPVQSVSPEVDRAILSRAREQFEHRGGRSSVDRQRVIRLVVWRWAKRGIAAAAVLMIGLWIATLHRSPKPAEEPSPVFSVVQEPTAKEDIDHNGRVDILDAFAMARRLESSGAVKKQWDFNGDGIVDRRDVDVVACAAVRIVDGG